MKYVVIQGDGMADFPVASLGGLTPLEKAHTPYLDRLAGEGRLGLVRTIPAGMPAGTDVGTMTILGYDPLRFHSGRAPIEAASMGIDLADDDVAFRCNLVTIDRDAGDNGRAGVMKDFTAGHVSSEEAAEIIGLLQERLGGDGFDFHSGVSYRHLMVWHGGEDGMKTTPPHDITDRPIADHLPSGRGADSLAQLSDAARELIASHPVNERRTARNESPVTDIWLWGQGRRPAIPTLTSKYGIEGGVITAVDVVGGLGRLAGLHRIQVPGITGFVDTNFRGKGEYALAALDTMDFVFVHVEAPDESGHMGDAELKVKSIEELDSQVLGTILEGIGRFEQWAVMVLPDHGTPVSTKTHSADPVPFAILGSREARGSGCAYGEREAAATGVMIEDGSTLLGRFLGDTWNEI